MLCYGKRDKSLDITHQKAKQLCMFVQECMTVFHRYWIESGVALSVSPVGYRDSNSSKGKGFFSCPKCPDRLWGPPTLLFNGYQSSFLGIKWLGHKVNHSPPTSAKVKNKSLRMPSWRGQWQLYLWMNRKFCSLAVFIDFHLILLTRFLWCTSHFTFQFNPLFHTTKKLYFYTF
jgi:hypothetical protein